MLESDGGVSGRGLSTFSISPIRSQPQRTYDPTSEFDAPEARDMSMELMRTKASGKKGMGSLETSVGRIW